MSLVVRAVAETFATKTACIRLLPSVDPVVLNQGGFVSEAIPTLRADVGLLARVDSLVPEEVGTDVEAFFTDVALVGLLPCVDAHVFDKVGIVAETPQTFCAGVQHLRLLLWFRFLATTTTAGVSNIVARGTGLHLFFH